MPTRREVVRLDRANKGLVAAARRELFALVSLLPSDPDARLRELVEAFRALVTAYGDAGLAVVQEWIADTAPRSVEPQVGPAVSDAAIVSVVSEVLQRPEAQTPEGVARLLRGPLQRMVLQPGREAAKETAVKFGGRWARVPTRANPCAFCVVLASLGSWYKSSDTAGGEGYEDRYHDDCYCVATPIWTEGDYPDGYDPEALYKLYSAASSDVGSTYMRKVAARMRQLYGMR